MEQLESSRTLVDSVPELFLSVVIPARNEEANLEPTVLELLAALDAAKLRYEIIIVNDGSTDDTLAVATGLARRSDAVRVVSRTALGGFGRAVRAGLAAMRGDLVVIVMADRSDDPQDVVRYYRKIAEGYDCVFGSRFRKGSRVTNYPFGKLIVNRSVNRAIQMLFWTRFNDLTNAFKAYRRHVVEACGPYSSSHFNITIEMSLSALVRRYQIAEIPISWYGRTWGASKLSVAAMGRRYLSVLIKCYCEKLLVADDVLEERLAEHAWAAGRLREVEARVAQLEARVLAPAAGSDRDAAAGR